MTISFSRLGKMGRLGNQLWQIAATYGYAESHAMTPAFPQWEYQRFFDPELPHGAFGTTIHKELRFEYDDDPGVMGGDTDLYGYFQSYKYFPKELPIKFKPAFLNEQRAKLPAGEKICIHIRRTDYVNHEAYYQLPVTWYIKALMSIPNWRTLPIIFISDDLGYSKTHFECLTNAHFPKGNEAEHMAMGSLCDHFICSNSSFSWWSAYLGPQTNVIYPSEYFRGSYSNKSTRDLWPDSWHPLDVNDHKLDLSDLTFTIPVNHDSHDRKKNLDLSICHLQKHINAPIIVGECLSNQFSYMSEWVTYRHYPHTEFHRTKMLNDMANEATTPFIANWDADIFIPPMQVWCTVDALRNGAQMVYPYDGRFARMDRFPWFKRIEQTVDIGTVSDNTLSGRAIKESVGGAVCWNKEAFIEYGMENEHMISYAPEDVERYERAFKLGCNISNVGGVLYHMDHFKGPDSSNKTPHFVKSRALLEGYRKMTADELRKEVDTWGWRHQYTPAYYERFIESAQRSAREVYRVIDKHIPRLPIINHGNGYYENAGMSPSVIDIGCGLGEWSLNNPYYYGIDYGIPKNKLLIPKDKYINCDLEKSNPIFGAQLLPFDLVICLEVMEHISEARADFLIEWMCGLSNLVLFSAAIPAQGGTGHINEQWQTYWAEKFAANGFGALTCYPVKDNPNVDMWYRQNMMLYRRGATGKVHNFILPEYYEQIILHRDNQIQELSDRCASLQRRLGV